MVNGLLIATQTAPSVPAWLNAGAAAGAVIVTLLVLAATLGRKLVTKDDLATLKSETEKAHARITEGVTENRHQIHQIGETMHSIDRSVTFISGRLHERDQASRDAVTVKELPKEIQDLLQSVPRAH